MSEKKKLVPKRRFKEFENADPWEQRKLEDIGNSMSGTSIESEFSSKGIFKVISIGSYSENSTYVDQKIRAKKSEKTLNRVLNSGDLTMILNDKTSSGRIIGRVLLIKRDGVFVYNQRTQRISPNREEFNSTFLYQLLNAKEIRKKIINESQGNTQIYVNWSRIKKIDYLFPNIKEQKELGEFFAKIDNLITLHQRAHLTIYYKGVVKWLIKLEKPTYLLIIILNGLKFIKKALLEKLRCQNIE